jgi:hypothetical protein
VKKNRIAIAAAMLLVYHASAQNFIEFESLGYNAVETTEYSGLESRIITETDYYMIHNPVYSKMRIWYFDYGPYDTPSDNLLSPILGNSKYHLMEEYHYDGEGYFLREWPLPDGLIHQHNKSLDAKKGVIAYGGPMGSATLYFMDADGKLEAIEYVAQYGDPGPRSRSVVYNSDGSISVDFGDSHNAYIRTKRFYNIPEQKLTDMYLSLFTQQTRHHLNKINEEMLMYRTKEELAIIRNCLFAKYNYAFQSPKWQNFILTYYDRNYRGIYSNEEVSAKFTGYERALLQMILAHEKKR